MNRSKHRQRRTAEINGRFLAPTHHTSGRAGALPKRGPRGNIAVSAAMALTSVPHTSVPHISSPTSRHCAAQGLAFSQRERRRPPSDRPSGGPSSEPLAAHRQAHLLPFLPTLPGPSPACGRPRSTRTSRTRAGAAVGSPADRVLGPWTQQEVGHSALPLAALGHCGLRCPDVLRCYTCSGDSPGDEQWRRRESRLKALRPSDQSGPSCRQTNR